MVSEPKKSRMEKWKIKTLLITFYDSKGIIHKEFVPPGKTVNAVYYLGVMKRLLARIRRVRPEYRESRSWRLLHDNEPSHRSTLVTAFFIKNHILTLNHSPYSPDLAPCDFYLFGKFGIWRWWKADVELIQTATTSILKMIPANDLKKSFDMLFERAKLGIDSKGVYFEANK